MITRRQFNLRSVKLAVIAPFARLFNSQPTTHSPASEHPEIGFPPGDYTPYGYLDNPYHSWAFNRSGVLRSLYGVGFGWHYPAGPGGYFDEKKNGIYSAFLRLGFIIGIPERHLWDLNDFRDGELTCPYHSTKLMTYEIKVSGVQLLCTFVQVEENALAVRIQRADSAIGVPAQVVTAHQYQLGNSEWWGGDGIVGQYRAGTDSLVTRSFAAGAVFAIGSDIKSRLQFFESTAEPMSALSKGSSHAKNGISYAHDPLQGIMTYEVTPNQIFDVILARAVNESAAINELNRAKQRISQELSEKRSSDARFWKNAPRLEGDWPKHWRNGWVYDLETLRMMVRRPVGAYKNPWDAMQIQAPRNVLAETSIDMWALSHAEPETAKDVFLGQFLDAIEPNVPCMREDTVMNMVAADGSECGTSISWCYPFFCAASIHARTGDLKWLGRLYPRLARLLRWTMANRSDKDGFIVGKCSWETGMDGARRFLIEQPTGAELIDFIRVVELQAATAHAAGVLEKFAQELGQERAAAEWKHIRQVYAEKTQQLWNGADWFHDFDTRNGNRITTIGKDIGQVAPIFCGVATEQQFTAMIPTLRAFYEQSRGGSLKNEDGWVDGLQWSSLTLPYLESLWTGGEYELLSQVVHMIAQRVYPSMDRREVKNVEGTWVIQREGNSRVGIPGVSCEMWTPQGAAGGEGYGWGAVLPAHIMRNVIGIRESGDSRRLWLCPNLPAEFMIPGKSYILRNWRYRQLALAARYSVQDDRRLEVDIEFSPTQTGVRVFDPEGKLIQTRNVTSSMIAFTTENRHRYALECDLIS